MKRFPSLAVIIGITAILYSCKNEQNKIARPFTYPTDYKKQFLIPLDSGRWSRDSFLARYIGERQHKAYNFDSSFYSLTYSDSMNGLPVSWSFVSRNDSLDQYGFSFDPCPVEASCFDSLFAIADSLVRAFASRFGPPLKSANNKMTIRNNKPFWPFGEIVKAMWIINDQKIKIDFSIDGEHQEYHYYLKVSKFKDYYGNLQLPPWWDGY